MALSTDRSTQRVVADPRERHDVTEAGERGEGGADERERDVDDEQEQCWQGTSSAGKAG